MFILALTFIGFLTKMVQVHPNIIPVQVSKREILNFLQEKFSNILTKLHFAQRFFSHVDNFNEIFSRKMTKSLNISLKNNI